MRANDNTLRRGERKRGFDRNRLPTIADYYQPVFGELRFNASGWAQVHCVFHEDGHASLSIHREAARSGASRATREAATCSHLRCCAHFKGAARALGAWR
jgi:hypothetical protein